MGKAEPETFPVGAVARLLDLTPRRVQQLVDEGVIPKTDRGRYELVPVVRAYVQYLRQAGGGTATAKSEHARLMRERADHQALKNAALRAELLPAAEVVAGWQAAISRARALLLGIPIGAASTLVMLATGREPQDAERAIREELIRLIDGALSELQNTKLDEAEDDGSQPADEGGAGAGSESVGATQARAAK